MIIHDMPRKYDITELRMFSKPVITLLMMPNSIRVLWPQLSLDTQHTEDTVTNPTVRCHNFMPGQQVPSSHTVWSVENFTAR